MTFIAFKMETTLPANVESSTPQIRDIHELGLTIAAKNLNPTMLSEEFLKFSGIIPTEWALAKQPVLNPRLAQLTFQNGLTIVAQPATITFMEGIGPQGLTEFKSATIAQSYLEKLPYAEYQALSITPKSLIPMPDNPDSARKYITEILLSPGPWQELGKAPMQAGLNLLYQLERAQLSLNINEAKIQLSEQMSIAALLFSGSFNYAITGETEPERLNRLKEVITYWREDWDIFTELVNQRFLRQSVSVFPASVM